MTYHSRPSHVVVVSRFGLQPVGGQVVAHLLVLGVRRLFVEEEIHGVHEPVFGFESDDHSVIPPSRGHTNPRGRVSNPPLQTARLCRLRLSASFPG